MFVVIGEVPEWSKGADCKSVGYAFEGSNPSLPIGSFHKERSFFYGLQIKNHYGVALN
jgi:hypothetical protein